MTTTERITMLTQVTIAIVTYISFVGLAII